MLIQDCKSLIQNNTLDRTCLIFECNDNNFVGLQYVHKIAQDRNQEIVCVSSCEEVIKDYYSVFSTRDDNILYLYMTSVFSFSNFKLRNVQNFYIVCTKVEKETKELFSSQIVSIPKLENWMLKDYIKSCCTGLLEEDVNYLLDICNENIYRLENELKKIKIFDPVQQSSLFKDFKNEGLFNDLSSKTIFDLSNAIIRKDFSSVRDIYSQLDCIDVEPIGLLVILYKNIRNIILVQLDSSATATKTGISDKQFWVIKKYSCGFYSKKELLSMFAVLTDIDRMIKSGEMPMELLIDYLIVKTLGVVK